MLKRIPENSKYKQTKQQKQKQKTSVINRKKQIKITVRAQLLKRG